MTRPDIGQPHLFEPPPSIRLTLADKFLVPPFSVLEARAGYWQERKREWLNIGLMPELGREAALLYSSEEGMLDSGAGRGGRKAITGGRQAHDVRYYARLREWQEAEEVRKAIAEVEGREYVPGEPPEPSAAGAFDSGAGRGESLLSGATPRAGYGGDYDTTKGENAWGGAGTSIFDPVLCELVYRWFSPEGGGVLDPFAGGSVRGIVAAHLGRAYCGIDLRPEQVKANYEQAERIGNGYEWPRKPVWLEGDCLEVLSREVRPEGADLVFSCPPYYDLEVYSDDPRDLSAAGTYEEFAKLHAEAIRLAGECLKADRFAVWVVGEVRTKRGHYVGLVPDTIAAFEAAGLKYYNEGILVTSVGSLPIRTSRLFAPGRKLGKTHQNVLVFVKGDWREAAKACPIPLEVAIEYGGATWDASGEVHTEEEVVHFTGVEPGT